MTQSETEYSIDTSQREDNYYEERKVRKFVEFLQSKNALKMFSYCHYTNSYQFKELDLSDSSVNDLELINMYPSISYLNLSRNDIKDLKQLVNLPHLVHLDLSFNLLKSAEFAAVPFKLQHLNLSNNGLRVVPNLLRFDALETLNLSNNKIEDITNLEQCRNMVELDISHNHLNTTRGLKGLGLRFLNLNNNEIVDIHPDFETLVELMVFMANRNYIAELAHLKTLQKLRVLDLGANQVQSFKEIEYLQDLLFLSEIDLCHNPIQEKKYYHLQMLYRLPLLRKMDGDIVSPEMKINGETFYGLDLDDRNQIWKYFLQHEDFIDTRVTVHDELEEESRD